MHAPNIYGHPEHARDVKKRIQGRKEGESVRILSVHGRQFLECPVPYGAVGTISVIDEDDPELTFLVRLDHPIEDWNHSVWAYEVEPLAIPTDTPPGLVISEDGLVLNYLGVNYFRRKTSCPQSPSRSRSPNRESGPSCKTSTETSGSI